MTPPLRKTPVSSAARWDSLSAAAETPVCSKILDNLYISAFPHVQNHDEIFVKNSITHVLSVIAEGFAISIPKEHIHKRVSLPDVRTEDLLSVLPSTITWMDSVLEIQGAILLVHCMQGVSRSVSIVVAWLMRRNSWTMGEALEFVKERRSSIRPNPGFLAQLREWEKQLLEISASAPRKE